MMADWVPAQMSFDPHARRILDTARGILMGLRRCPSEAAFHELLDAAQRHKVPVFALAWGLVHLACGGETASHNVTDAQSAARHEWGQLFAKAAVSAC
jgi:ANTAR domain